VQFGADVAERVLAPLDALIGACEALKPALREREGIKTDVDARARTLDALKNAGGGKGASAEQLAHKAAKLQASRDLLDKATGALGERMRPLERESLEGSLPSALAAFARAQADFHAAAAAALADAAAPAQAQARVAPPPQAFEHAHAAAADGEQQQQQQQQQRGLPPLPPRAAPAAAVF
jgi:hypothetical protein